MEKLLHDFKINSLLNKLTYALIVTYSTIMSSQKQLDILVPPWVSIAFSIIISILFYSTKKDNSSMAELITNNDNKLTEISGVVTGRKNLTLPYGDENIVTDTDIRDSNNIVINRDLIDNGQSFEVAGYRINLTPRPADLNTPN